MHTVGELLKTGRLNSGFSLEQVEKATKIRAKFIQALESDNFQKLPDVPYIQGFIKNYADFLGLNSQTLQALFRRQYLQKQQQLQPKLEEPLTHTGWQITPNKAILTVVAILMVILFGYFFSQYQKLHQPPPLILEGPKDEVVVDTEAVSVFGKTDRDATVTINQEPILVKPDGKFFKDTSLTIGGNTLVVEAVSRVGEKTTVTRRVTRIASS